MGNICLNLIITLKITIVPKIPTSNHKNLYIFSNKSKYKDVRFVFGHKQK